MRKIGVLPITTGWAFVALAGMLAFLMTEIIFGTVNHEISGTFYEVAMGVGLFYLFMILIYRTFLFFTPLEAGEISRESSQQIVYDIYILFYLAFFYPILRSKILPVPLYRLFYQLLGAKLGPNTFPAGMLFDPCFVEIGANGIIGDGARLVPHVLEGSKLAHYKIRVGNDVTIGLQSTVLAGSIVEDGAVVAAHSVVAKHTHIKKGEIWAGVPARKIA